MLIDSNIIIEIAKKQGNYESCRIFLNAINRDQIKENVYMTQFTFDALAAMISKFDLDFLKKIFLMIHQGKIQIKKMNIEDNLMILNVQKELGFDFDDCTQYVAANKLGTYLVTFDKGFQGKGIEIKTPAEVLKSIHLYP